MPVRRHLIIIGGYTAISLLLTWPAISRITTDVIGRGGDPWQTMWRFEDTWQRAQTAVSASTLGAFVRTEFLGGGEARLVNLSVWPWLWLHVLFGEPLTYNLVWLLSFGLSGYAMYGLVRTLGQTGSRAPFSVEAGAWLAGLVYLALPYHVAHAQGHFGALQIQWLPLIFLATIAFFRHPTLTRSTLVALLVIIQAWTEHHYAVWLVVVGLLAAVLYRHHLRTWLSDRRSLKWLVIGLMLAAAGVITTYAPTIRQARLAGVTLTPGIDQTVRFSADFFAYVVPAPFHPWWGALTHAIFSQNFTGNVAEATHFLGLVPLLLVVFFFSRTPFPSKKFWAVTAVFFAVLSFGPRLHVQGYVTSLPLPYALFAHLPVFSAIRAIARAGSLVGLAVSVLFGLVVAANVRRTVNFVLIAALVVIEFLFYPTPTQSAELGALYRAVADLPGESIIEIPAATNYDLASRSLYASGYHHKKVIDNIALERGKTGETAGKKLPGLRQLLYLRTTDLREGRQEFFGQALAETLPDVVTWQRVSAIVLHPDSLSAFQVTVLRNFLENDLRLTPHPYDDAWLYPTADLALRSDGIFAVRGEGWANIGFDKKRASTFAQIPRAAALGLVNVTPVSKTVELHFTIPPESHAGLTVRYQGATIPLASNAGRRYRAGLVVPPGFSQVVLNNGLPEPVIMQNPALKVIAP